MDCREEGEKRRLCGEAEKHHLTFFFSRAHKFLLDDKAGA